MERLSDRAIEIINELHTERLDYNSEYLPLIDAANKLNKIENIYDLDRLCELVQANREGRCVVSPCKVGDRLYTIRTIQDGNFTLEVYDSGEIRQISVNINGTFFLVDYGHSLNANNFGKTVFRTREEAEAALKERKVNSKSIEVNDEVN